MIKSGSYVVLLNTYKTSNDTFFDHEMGKIVGWEGKLVEGWNPTKKYLVRFGTGQLPHREIWVRRSDLEVVIASNAPLRKYKRRNWKLEKKRNVGRVSSDVFTVRIKPTTHKQECAICGIEFVKNEKQILTRTMARLIHPESGEQKTYAKLISLEEIPRHHREYLKIEKLYLHPKCFACEINRVSLLADLPILKTEVCESCDKRFVCFSNNMKFIPRHKGRNVIKSESSDYELAL